MVRWRQARRPARQHGPPGWAEPTMLAELHALKLPAGTVGSPLADGRRGPRPANPANYIVVMMRRASFGALPRVVRSARRLGVAIRSARSALCSTLLLSAISIRTFEFAARAIIPPRYPGGAGQLDSCHRIRTRRGGQDDNSACRGIVGTSRQVRGSGPGCAQGEII
jgi:hypothetical protein